MTEHPLFERDDVVVTPPHLGATTEEAQDRAGDHRGAGARGADQAW